MSHNSLNNRIESFSKNENTVPIGSLNILSAKYEVSHICISIKIFTWLVNLIIVLFLLDRNIVDTFL